MDVGTILDLVLKGINVANILIEAGMNAAPALDRLKNVVTGAQNGTLTPEEIAENRKALDDLIADFNEPMED